MAHLIQAYANYCGVEPLDPHIQRDFYPISQDRYVVVHTQTGMKTKDYSFWEDVCGLIKLPIVQVGGKDDPIIDGSLDLRSKTSWNHTADIISKASAFIGCDSVCAHMASMFGVPSVILFGATNASTCGPYWNRSKSFVLEPKDRGGCYQACHSRECVKEMKCIDRIKPDNVLVSLSHILGRDNVQLANFCHFGKMAKVQLTEWVPISANDDDLQALKKATGIIGIRIDKTNCDVGLASSLANKSGQKFLVVVRSDQACDLLINPEQSQRVLVVGEPAKFDELTEAMSCLRERNYNAFPMSYSGHAEFSEHKLKMLDWAAMVKIQTPEFTDDERKALVGKNFRYSTKRIVLGKDGGVYPTIFDSLKKQVADSEKGAINIEEGHLQELNFLTLFNYA